MAEPSTSQNEVPIEDPTQYKGWMSKLGQTPSGDAKTLFTGLMAPWILLGRVDERLLLVSKGLDINDIGSGCNGSGWIWLGSCAGLCGAMTANRRTRVRGQYGIDGGIVNDCVLSLFCNHCVLMQLDREIRARHGHTKFCTHPEYKKVLDQQPRLTHEMVYMSTERSRDAPNHLPTACSPTAIKVSTRHQLQEVLNASGLDETLEEVVTVVTVVQNMTIPVVENTAELVQAGPPSPTKSIKSFLGNMTPDFKSYFEKKRVKSSPETYGHTMVSMKSNAASTEHNSRSARTHAMAQCTKVETKGKKVMSEHSLTDCGTIVVGGQRSSNASVQQMSYVHDFTDCPVDRDILEYMEREEKRSHENEPDDCLIEASTPRENLGPDSVNCCVESSTTSNRVSQQHSLGDCANSFVLEGVEQHILGDCSRLSSIASEVVQQHHLDDCTRLNKIASAVVKDIVQRQAPEVSRARSQKAEASKVTERPGFTTSVIIEESTNSESSQVDVQPCCDHDSEDANDPQHRLSTCSQDLSYEGGHRMSDCPPPADLPSITHHRLSTCSHNVSSDEGEQQHRISDFPPPADIPSTTQHRLSTCSHDGSSDEGGKHHGLSDCTPSNLSTGQNSPLRRVSDCSQTIQPLATTVSQNRFWPFSRSSSASALIINKNNQDRLGQGIRSISMPVPGQKKSEQPVEESSRRSSVTITPPKRFFSAASHTLENCRCGESSEENHQHESLVPEPEAAGKVMQQALEVSNVGTLTPQEVENSQNLIDKSETPVQKAQQNNRTARKSASSGSLQSPKQITVRRRMMGKTEPAVNESRKGDREVNRATSSGVRPTRVIKTGTPLGSQCAPPRNSLGTQVIRRIELCKTRSVSSSASTVQASKKAEQAKQRAVSSGILPTQVNNTDNGKQRARERSDSTIRTSKNVRNQHSEEVDVYDDYEQQNSTETKPRVVVLSVDVIVGGKKMKAMPFNHVDGNNSPRPSVTYERRPQSTSPRSLAAHERSAQTSLQNVLAGSQRSHGYGEVNDSVRRHPNQLYARSRTLHHNENYENGDGVVILGTPGPISTSIHQAESSPSSRRDSDVESLQTSIASGILSVVTGLGRRTR